MYSHPAAFSRRPSLAVGGWRASIHPLLRGGGAPTRHRRREHALPGL